jgi:hypothetical protein
VQIARALLAQSGREAGGGAGGLRPFLITQRLRRGFGGRDLGGLRFRHFRSGGFLCHGRLLFFSQVRSRQIQVPGRLCFGEWSLFHRLRQCSDRRLRDFVRFGFPEVRFIAFGTRVLGQRLARQYKEIVIGGGRCMLYVGRRGLYGGRNGFYGRRFRLRRTPLAG